MEKKKSKPDKPELCNNVHLDNKLIYEQTSKEVESVNADHDHPLKSDKDHASNSPDMLKMDELSKEFDSVAVDWKALRNINECSCSLAFDPLSKKNYCRKCGDIFCVRCITKQVILPGHTTQKAVPVCKPCYDILGNNLDI